MYVFAGRTNIYVYAGRTQMYVYAVGVYMNSKLKFIDSRVKQIESGFRILVFNEHPITSDKCTRPTAWQQSFRE